MGAFLLGAGSPGKRKSLPNSRIMIHQPLGGAAGQAADIEIQVWGCDFVCDTLTSRCQHYLPNIFVGILYLVHKRPHQLHVPGL